jgi:starvation-inducible outer membrane lipoprotein
VGAAELKQAVDLAVAAGRTVTVAWPITSNTAGMLSSAHRLSSPVLERSGYQLWEVGP